MKISDKIRQSEMDMVLTDVYWATVNGVGNEDKIEPEKVLVLVQYMLTAYLSTIPDMTEVQVQVLELLRQVLPQEPMPGRVTPKWWLR